MSTPKDPQTHFSALHAICLKDGKDNTSNALKIVSIMGGIDKLITDYLSDTNDVDQFLLNEHQSQQIYDLIKNKSNFNPKSTFNRHKTKTLLTDTINIRDYDEEEFSYTFYENDTLLYKSQFLKNHPNILHGIVKTYDSRICLATVGLTILIYNILNKLFPEFDGGTISHAVYSLTFCLLIWAPFAIYRILTVNRIALKLIVKNFEFGFRVIVSICHFIAIWVDYFGLQYHRWRYPNLAIIERIVFGITFILAIIVISLIDGMRIRKWAKVAIISVMAIFCSFYSITQMIIFAQSPDRVIVLSQNLVISIVSLQISTFSILSIFLCRQAVLIFLRKEGNGMIQGVLLRKTPYIIWNVEKNNGADLGMTSFNVSKQFLRTVHKQQTERNMNNDRRTKDIVGALGGIDQILTDYLNCHLSELNNAQLIKIHEIINYKPTLHKGNTLTSIDKRKGDDDDVNIYYFFDGNNTFLHQLVNTASADAIIKLFWSRMSTCVLVLSILLYAILLITNEMYVYNEATQIVLIIIGLIVFVPYAILFMLGCNKQAFICAATSFEFSLQVLYALLYVISSTINSLYLNPEQYTEFGISIELAIIDGVSISIWLMLTVICIAALDSIRLQKNLKITILSAVTTFGTLWTLYLWFIAPADEERRNNSILHINASFSVSLLSLEISGVRIVSIFVGQQLFWTIMQKNQAVFIYYTPHIQWCQTDKQNKEQKVILRQTIASSSHITENEEVNLAQHIGLDIIKAEPIRKTTTDDILDNVLNDVMNEHPAQS